MATQCLYKLQSFTFDSSIDFQIQALGSVSLCQQYWYILWSIMVSSRRNIKCIHITYAITLATFFVFRQVGGMDASDIYVPHPWKRSWIAAITAMLSSPLIVQSIIKKDKHKLTIMILLVSLPYLSTRLDPKLKLEYNFKYRLTQQKIEKCEKMRKISSEPFFSS